MSKKKKFRAEFRKNRASKQRRADYTREFKAGGEDDHRHGERIGKDERTRRRVVVGDETDGEQSGFEVRPDVDLAVCRRGRVLSVYGLMSDVEAFENAFNRSAACGRGRRLGVFSAGRRK
jgi:hypothetical protein